METTSKLIGGFVALLIGVVLLSQISISEQSKTQLTNVVSEVHNVASTIATGRNTTDVNASVVYTITNAPTGWKLEDCPITSFVLKNSSGGAFTVTTDYVFTAATGKYQLVNSATMNSNLPLTDNNTYASYSYCGDEYMNLSWGRVGMDLVPGLFAIALLLIAVGLFYSAYRDVF